MNSLRRCWNQFRTLPGWVKLTIGVALFLILTLGWVPVPLRWPVRILIPLIATWGYFEVFADRSELRFRDRVFATLRHPFTFAVALTWLSLVIQEAFPFSHFPMYSNPSSEQDYYYLAEAENEAGSQPLPVSQLTGLTSAKVGKIYRAYRDTYLKTTGKKMERLTAKDQQAIGEQVLEYLYEQAIKRNGPDFTAGEWQLMLATLMARGGEQPGISEEVAILARRDFRS